MQSQDLNFLRPSLSNALNCMSLIVLVQAPDRTLLSWEPCFQRIVQSWQRLWGPLVNAAEPRPHQGPHSPFIRSCSASLSPNLWSRPSQPGCPVKVKTTSGKQEQWNGDNSVFLMLLLIKETPPPLFFSETGRLRDFIFRTGWVYFQVSTVFLLQPEAVFFHIQQRFGSFLEGAMVLLFQTYYPNHCQCATG